MAKITAQEQHRLAMNIVGKYLEKNGYEFIAINSELGTNPQFVCYKDKQLSFVLVKNVLYPEDPNRYDPIWIESMKLHAITKKAELYYAGVGLANAEDMEAELSTDSNYYVKFDGLIRVH